MKSLTHKLLAITFSVALFTGCASVTDSGFDQPEQAQLEQQPTEQPTPTVDNPDFGTDQDMSMIRDKPE